MRVKRDSMTMRMGMEAKITLGNKTFFSPSPTSPES